MKKSVTNPILSILTSFVFVFCVMALLIPTNTKAETTVHNFASAEEFVSEFKNAKDGDTFKYAGSGTKLERIQIPATENPDVKSIILDPVSTDNYVLSTKSLETPGVNVTITNATKMITFGNLHVKNLVVEGTGNRININSRLTVTNADISNCIFYAYERIVGNVALHHCVIDERITKMEIYGGLTMDQDCTNTNCEITVIDPKTDKTEVLPVGTTEGTYGNTTYWEEYNSQNEPTDPTDDPVIDPTDDPVVEPGNDPVVTPSTPVKPVDTTVAVNRVTISGASKVAPFKKISLKATVAPSNATNKKVIWTSSNTKYATVSASGVVSAKKAGAGKTVTITATADGKKATKKIAINGLVKKITIKGKATVKAGKKIKLKAVIKTNGKNANKKLTWKVNKKKFASVNAKGIVKAKRAGKGKSIIVTATAKDGSKVKAKKKIRIR